MPALVAVMGAQTLLMAPATLYSASCASARGGEGASVVNALMTLRGHALGDLTVCATLRDNLHRSFWRLRLLVSLIHRAFEFA